MKSKTLILFALFLTLGCQSYKKSVSEEKTPPKDNRFSSYQLVSNKTEVINIKSIHWASIDRPNFITSENEKKYSDRDNLVNYCFYLDTYDNAMQFFSPDVIEDLNNGKEIRVTGKFYKTKKFDKVFPNKTFESMRMENALSFKPKGGYFRVFIYEKVERIN